MAEVKLTRGHSCVPCQQRKIRCNGQTPCAHCIRTGKDCVRRRMSPQTPNSRNARLNQRRVTPSQTGASSDDGQVVVSGDQRRYVEDNKLWKTLGNEMDGREASPDPNRPSLGMGTRTEVPATEINLIFGRPKSESVPIVHPSAVHAFQLWQVFTSNVHPLTKLLHGPSVQKDLLRVLCEPPSTMGPIECLIFSIYLVAVVSLTDKECSTMFGESREVLLARYCNLTEVALSRADFLRSTDLRVLQAFTLYLLSLRHLCDHDILWLLTGVATRMSQRMGLHRESSLKDLAPFDAELRRRVWWQVVILDGRTAQLTGASMNPDMQLYGDTRKPLNLNDADLVPSVSSLPQPTSVATEMVFCSVRIEIGVWMIEQKCMLSSEMSNVGKAKFFKAIDDLERHIEEKYLRSMDMDVPLNLLTSFLARSAVCQMRLSVYHPIHRPERASDLNSEQLGMLLENSLEVIRYDILSHSSPSLQCYMWHVANFFPFETFVLLISTLTDRTADQIVDTAWGVIDQVYEHHPCFISDTNDPLYWALGNLTLKAWEKTIAGTRARAMQPPAKPQCIAQLVRERATLANDPQQARTNADSTGPETPKSLPLTHNLPGGVAHDPNAVRQQLKQGGQGADVNMTTGEGFLGMKEGVDMDWSFWQGLLDGNTHGARGREDQEIFPFSSFMSRT